MVAPSIPFETVERLAVRARVASPLIGYALPGESRVVGPAWVPFYGTKSIAGTVKVLTVGAPNRVVRLYDRESGRLAFETISGLGGAYSFPAVFGGRQYYAIALDAQPGGYNATIEDLVEPA